MNPKNKSTNAKNPDENLLTSIARLGQAFMELHNFVEERGIHEFPQLALLRTTFVEVQPQLSRILRILGQDSHSLHGLNLLIQNLDELIPPQEQQPNNNNPQNENDYLAAPLPLSLKSRTSTSVLSQVFKNLSIQDLKTCRFVSQNWNKAANAVFAQKQSWALHVDVKFKKRYNSKTLSDLNNVIDASLGKFPCSKLIFGYSSQKYEYSNPELRRFYEQQGPKITALELQYFSGTIQVFKDLILNRVRLPNIRSLLLKTIWIEKGVPSKFVNSLKGLFQPNALPLLETLEYELDQNPASKADLALFKSLLSAAPNLKEIKNTQPHMLRTIIDVGKLNCIKSFEFFPTLKFTRVPKATKGNVEGQQQNQKPKTILKKIDGDSFHIFALSQPKLKHLHINLKSCSASGQNVDGSLVNCLNLILQSSSQTLLSLRMTSFCFTPGLKIPTLERIQPLTIDT